MPRTASRTPAQATRGDDRAADERPEAVARTRPQPDPLPGYVWYVRVADVAGFLRQVAPVLEARLAASALAGHNGTLALSFYRTGVRLVVEQGRLVEVVVWPSPGQEEGGAGFPDQSFLQLLFGVRAAAVVTTVDQAPGPAGAAGQGGRGGQAGGGHGQLPEPWASRPAAGTITR
jgi:hypothetical protein